MPRLQSWPLMGPTPGATPGDLSIWRAGVGDGCRGGQWGKGGVGGKAQQPGGVGPGPLQLLSILPHGRGQ